MGDGLRVGLLGPTVVELDGRTVPVAGAPQRAVLARLALSAGRTVPDDALVDVLWPGGGPDNALGNLQSYVSRLRRAVGAGAVARDTIGYRLDVPPEAIDVGRFDALVARAEGAADAAGAVALFAEALDLWRGEPFCDLADALALAPDRARLAALHRRAVEGWLAARSAAGEGSALLPDLERAAAQDPAGEAVHLLLMAVLHQVGRSPDALRVGSALRERIVDATGLDPSSAVGEMERRILADDPTLRPDAGGARPLAARRGPRLAPADRFVGRAAELEALAAALDGHRIVSVVGPGGVGKTRLVQELIDRGGLTPVVVDLAPIEDEGDVLVRAAAALGIQGSTTDLDAALVDAVAGRPITLVLHSCEHVIGAARALVAQFLEAAPAVAVLATSRVRLGLAAEKVIRLTGLGPDEQVELFRDRASLLRDDFVVTDEVAALVRSIGRQLDGLPLALELAAGREAVFGLAQLDAQLAVALDVVEPLGAGGRKSVTSAVEWSYGLLSPRARDLFDRLSVAPGGVTLEALAHLFPDGTGPAAAALGELVEASLVDVDLGADPPRYRALEVVRRVGLEHLSRDARAEARRRLRHWMEAHVERTEALRMSRSALSTVLFRRELANLAAALVVEHPEDRLGLGPLAADTSTMVYDDPQVEVLERLRALAPEPGPLDEDQALCALAAGVAAWIGGETEPAADLLARALFVLPAGHPRRWSATFAAVPNAMFIGDVTAVEAMAQELLDDPATPDWALAVGVGCAALMRLYTGDEEARGWVDDHADLLGRAATLDGFVAFTYGELAAATDPEAAIEWYARSARLSDALGATYTREIAGLGRAAVLVREGRTKEAARACRDVVRATSRIGMWPQVWTTLRIAAELLVAEEHHELALVVLVAAEGDPKASTVMGPDIERLAGLRAEVDAALADPVRAAAEARGRTATRAEVVEDVLGVLTALA